MQDTVLEEPRQLALWDNVCNHDNCCKRLRLRCPGEYTKCGNPLITIHWHVPPHVGISVDKDKASRGMGMWAVSWGWIPWEERNAEAICNECEEERTYARECQEAFFAELDYWAGW